jgi:hypothetical protein
LSDFVGQEVAEDVAAIESGRGIRLKTKRSKWRKMTK